MEAYGEIEEVVNWFEGHDTTWAYFKICLLGIVNIRRLRITDEVLLISALLAKKP